MPKASGPQEPIHLFGCDIDLWDKAQLAAAVTGSIEGKRRVAGTLKRLYGQEVIRETWYFAAAVCLVCSCRPKSFRRFRKKAIDDLREYGFDDVADYILNDPDAAMSYF